MKMNLEWYNLFLKGYNIEVDANNLTTVTFTMSSPIVPVGEGPKLEELSRDISVINAIRLNNDPTVKDQWELLLTTVALTNGRNVPDVIDSMAKPGGKSSSTN